MLMKGLTNGGTSFGLIDRKNQEEHLSDFDGKAERSERCHRVHFHLAPRLIGPEVTVQCIKSPGPPAKSQQIMARLKAMQIPKMSAIIPNEISKPKSHFSFLR